MAAHTLIEHSCQKAVDRDNFSRGLQYFGFSLGRPNCIDLSKSYFKIDVSILGVGTNENESVNASDLIALAPHACGGLYNQAMFKMSGNGISEINQYLAQSYAIRQRIGKTPAWAKTVGDVIENTAGSFGKRVAALSLGTPSGSGLYESDNLTMRKPVTESKYYNTATVAIDTDGVVTGVETSFTTGAYPPTVGAAKIGDVLYVEGGAYNVVDITDDDTITVSPKPAVAVEATAVWYLVSVANETSNVQHNQFSMLYRPPLGIMDTSYSETEDTSLGPGEYAIHLMPDSNFVANFAQTANPLWNTANGFKVIINDVKFYAWTFKLKDQLPSRKFRLNEVFVTSKPIQSGDSSYQFNVPPSTNMIAVWIQSQQVGSNSLIPPTMFKALGTDNKTWGDTSLIAIQCNYANILQPSTKWSSQFTANLDGNTAAPNVNYMIQRYYDSNLFTGMATGLEGCETFQDYMAKGPYYLFKYNADTQSRSTDVQLNVTYGNVKSDPTISANVFICAFYTNLVEFVTSNGQIVSVQSRQS